ncbi:MAG: polysaccharide lyase 6 family protein [Akkermansiaceae bacterium]
MISHFKRLLPLRGLSVWLAISCCAYGAIYEVGSGDEVEELIESGKLLAGDEIVWADGEYADVELNIDKVDGVGGKPITLRAARPGGVVFRGESQLNIGAKWWVIDGFHFDGKTGGVNAYNSVQFRGQGGTGAEHVRLTRCALTDLTCEDESSKWVQIYGRFNTIDHCHFSGKNSKGALITVELGALSEGETAEHRIEMNYFGDVAPQEGTDNETIRVGFSGDQNKPARCVIQRNLFVRCNGENEIISNKSSFNTYYSNTFRACDGALVLRHGHHARVEGNYFFGDGAENAGGIRVVDSHHVILNNYMQDLTGTTWNAAFSILGGKQKSGGAENGYQAVDEILVAHNTMVNCKRSIFFNKAKGARAPSGMFANNLVSGSDGPLITVELSIGGINWLGNLMHGAEVGADVKVISADPQLRLRDGVYRLSVTSPVIGGAVVIPFVVEKDMDGELRPKSGHDIGADEVDGLVGNVATASLRPKDVGVSYLREREEREEREERGER